MVLFLETPGLRSLCDFVPQQCIHPVVATRRLRFEVVFGSDRCVLEVVDPEGFGCILLMYFQE